MRHLLISYLNKYVKYYYWILSLAKKERKKISFLKVSQTHYGILSTSCILHVFLMLYNHATRTKLFCWCLPTYQINPTAYILLLFIFLNVFQTRKYFLYDRKCNMIQKLKTAMLFEADISTNQINRWINLDQSDGSIK